MGIRGLNFFGESSQIVLVIGQAGIAEGAAGFVGRIGQPPFRIGKTFHRRNSLQDVFFRLELLVEQVIGKIGINEVAVGFFTGQKTRLYQFVQVVAQCGLAEFHLKARIGDDVGKLVDVDPFVSHRQDAQHQFVVGRKCPKLLVKLFRGSFCREGMDKNGVFVPFFAQFHQYRHPVFANGASVVGASTIMFDNLVVFHVYLYPVLVAVSTHQSLPLVGACRG